MTKCPCCGTIVDLPVIVDKETGTVATDLGTSGKMTGQELAAVVAMAEKFPGAATRAQLIDGFYGHCDIPDHVRKVVDVVIFRLREKLRPLGLRIETTRGGWFSDAPRRLDTRYRLVAFDNNGVDKKPARVAMVKRTQGAAP